jgi:hypothetical protein
VGDLSWPLGNVSFPDRLEGVYSLSILLSHLHDLSETSFPDDFEEFKMIYGQGFVSDWLEVDLEME